MSADKGGLSAPQLVVFRGPATVIARFVLRRNLKGATFWALLFGTFVAAKAIGYATAYPTVASRVKIAASFAHNAGLNAMLGLPHHITTVTGFTVWNTLAGMMIIGAIWGFLLASKSLRGEEEAGRWELLLAGPATARKATGNVLLGLGAALSLLYAVTAITFVLIGSLQRVDFSISAALFFALAASCGALEFMAIGALASQLMPTRSRSAGLAALIFGICFAVRAAGSTTSAHWLLNVTPLGWIDKLQPLYGPRPLWLLPIVGLTLVCSILAVALAGRRDLGASLFADRDSAPAHTRLLNSSLAAALRLSRAKLVSWLTAIGLLTVFFGLLTKSAAQALSGSAIAERTVNHLAHASQTVGADSFLGIVFFLSMTLIMAFAASNVNAMREDEAQGYLDNLLVRSCSRLRWLGGRLLLILVAVLLAGLLAGVGTWIGANSVGAGIPLHTLLSAGLNAMVPAVLLLGIGMVGLGFVPRFTSLIVYGVIAWSFLIELVSSGLQLNHWLLDSSVLQHMALAPAANANWDSNLILLLLAVVLGVIGAGVFNRRDLQAE